MYVFTRSAGVWAQQAYIKGSNTAAGDSFGALVALSADGNMLAVEPRGEDSNATGVNGAQSDNSASNAGAVYVFTRTAGVWAQQAYIKARNPNIDQFGIALRSAEMAPRLRSVLHRRAAAPPVSAATGQ